MACTSLITYAKSCGEGISGGVGKLYMIAYKDLANVTASTSTYSISEGGLIDEIGLVASQKFVEIGINRDTVGIKENVTKDVTKGTLEITTEMDLVITNMTPEARDFAVSVMSQPVAVLIKLRTGAFVAAGLNGFMEVSTIEAGSGIAGSDLNGYTFKFTGSENELLRTVDPTAVLTLI